MATKRKTKRRRKPYVDNYAIKIRVAWAKAAIAQGMKDFFIKGWDG